MYMYFEKINIVFLYIMQHLDTSGTYKHTYMHMHVQYLHVHTRCVPALVAQSIECPLRKSDVTGSIPCRDISKSLKMVLAAPRLALRLTGKSYDWSRQCQDSGTWCEIMTRSGA